jgi:hypothetical protein
LELVHRLISRGSLENCSVVLFDLDRETAWPKAIHDLSPPTRPSTAPSTVDKMGHWAETASGAFARGESAAEEVLGFKFPNDMLAVVALTLNGPFAEFLT